MNNIVMRKVALTASYQRLVAEPLVATVEISTPPSNSDPVIFQGDDGSEVPWLPGEFHSFVRINLADVKLKGTPGDVVTIVGGTW